MSPKTCVDAVIPVYRPDRDDKLLKLIGRLSSQTIPPGRIILMNTEEALFAPWAQRVGLTEKYPTVTVRHVPREAFDHAGTRNAGASCSDAAYLLFMTMDAVPADDRLVEQLLTAMEEDPSCAVAYARQLPAASAGETERIARRFNYPERSLRKTLADEQRLGIKASFSSNVCAMYRRAVFDELGGFAAPAIFNEDMVYAHAALHAGYSIWYRAEATVVHSHDYGASEQLHRNFDLGVSQAMHPEVFRRVSSEREGKRLVRETVSHLRKCGRRREIPRYLWICAARYTGFLLGKNYRLLPRSVILKCTNQKAFWKR